MANTLLSLLRNQVISMRRIPIAIMLALAFIVLFRLSGTAYAATASATGGCAEHSVNGFEMGVCISDRGTSGTQIIPDVYVNQQPEGPFICTLYIELWDGGNKIFQDAGHLCFVDHYTSTKELINPPGNGCTDFLHTSVWISFEGVFYRIGDSPSYQFCS